MDAFFLILLAITSIVGIAFIVERGWALRRFKILPPEVETAVGACRGAGDFAMVKQICERHPSPLSRLIALAYEHRGWPKAENIDTLQTQARHEVMRMERGMVILEIVVGIAPLLGLIGTIYGLIILFGGGEAQSLNDNKHVTTGISLALRATMLGLLTAIPALIAWSFYNKKIEAMAVELETVCDQFMRRLYRHSSDADSAPKVEKKSAEHEKEAPAKVEKKDASEHEKQAHAKVERKNVPEHEKEISTKPVKEPAQKSGKEPNGKETSVESIKDVAVKTDKATEKKV